MLKLMSLTHPTPQTLPFLSFILPRKTICEFLGFFFYNAGITVFVFMQATFVISLSDSNNEPSFSFFSEVFANL